MEEKYQRLEPFTKLSRK